MFLVTRSNVLTHIKSVNTTNWDSRWKRSRRLFQSPYRVHFPHHWQQPHSTNYAKLPPFPGLRHMPYFWRLRHTKVGADGRHLAADCWKTAVPKRNRENYCWICWGVLEYYCVAVSKTLQKMCLGNWRWKWRDQISFATHWRKDNHIRMCRFNK